MQTNEPKIVIYVRGGVVTDCVSNDKNLRVCLIDMDDLEEEYDEVNMVEAAAESQVISNGFYDCSYNITIE